MSILILTDSRGFTLQRVLEELDIHACPFSITIWAYSGRTIEGTVTACLNDMGVNTFSVIYLLTRVNNLTIYHGSHNVSPKFNSWSMLAKDLLIEYYEARKRLLPYAGRVIVCQLIGMHIFTYTFHQGNNYRHEQHVLNCGVLRLNEYIEEMNDNHGVISPALEERVHKQRGPEWIAHRYLSTLWDGLHFNSQTANKIMDRILINAYQMLNLVS